MIVRMRVRERVWLWGGGCECVEDGWRMVRAWWGYDMGDGMDFLTDWNDGVGVMDR